MFKRYMKWLAIGLVSTSVSHAQPSAGEDVFKAVLRDDGSALSTLFLRGADPNVIDDKGQTALTLAIRNGSPRAVEQLLAHPDLKADAANAHGETALMMAALRGNLAWMRQLLDKGAAVEREGWAPLHYAAASPQVEAVRLLLDRGARIDTLAPNGTTPLMMAARYGSEDSVRLLLARGADVKRRNERALDAVEFAKLGGRDALAKALDKE